MVSAGSVEVYQGSFVKLTEVLFEGSVVIAQSKSPGAI